MKNKNNSIFIIIGAVLIITIIILFYFYNSKPKKYVWYEDYSAEKEQPYQVKYIKRLLPTIYPNKEFKEINFPARKYLDTVTVPTNYIYIGNNLFLNEKDKESLLSFVDKGNIAFISTNVFPAAFNDSLFITPKVNEEGYYYIDTLYYPNDSISLYEQFNEEFGYAEYTDSTNIEFYDTVAYRYYWDVSLDYSYNTFNSYSVSTNFTHPNLESDSPYKFENINKDKLEYYKWSYIEPDNFVQYNTIGYYNSGKVNCVRLKYGNGFIYLHTLPKAFTNYYLLDENGYEYSKKIFGHLKPGAILYDEYNRRYHYESTDNFNNNQSQSPLYYILNQRGFRWAWYLLLSLGVLYIVFKTKREQRAIPVLIQNQNTSLEFIKTIGTIYLNEKNHKRLVYQKMNLFLSYIRDRYRLPTKDLDDKLIKQIALLSEIEERRIRFIFKKFNDLSNQSAIKDDELIKFYKAMRYFYKHSK